MSDRNEMHPKDSQYRGGKRWIAADCGHVTGRVWKLNGKELCGDCMLRVMNEPISEVNEYESERGDE